MARPFVLLAVRRLDGERAASGDGRHLAEADLDARHDGIVGEARGHVGAVEHFFEVVEFAQVHELAAWRELVETKKALRPARAASVAAVRPAGPAPMTITSLEGGAMYPLPKSPSP